MERPANFQIAVNLWDTSSWDTKRDRERGGLILFESQFEALKGNGVKSALFR